MLIAGACWSRCSGASSSRQTALLGSPPSTAHLGGTRRRQQPGIHSHHFDDSYHECTVRSKPGESSAAWQHGISKHAMSSCHCCGKLGSKPVSTLICISPQAEQPEQLCSSNNEPHSLRASHSPGSQLHCSLCLHPCG